MTTAQRITKRMEATGRRRSKNSIYAIVSDEHNVHRLTEAHLDAWWESLKPEDKAALYELHLDGALDELTDYENNLLHSIAPSVIEDYRCGRKKAHGPFGSLLVNSIFHETMLQAREIASDAHTETHL